MGEEAEGRGAGREGTGCLEGCGGGLARMDWKRKREGKGYISPFAVLLVVCVCVRSVW